MRFKKYQRIETAERLLKWMLCVPKLRTNSPRFAYYADNWNVLEKIRRFVESGEFASIVKDCPAFSSEELRAALDYIVQQAGDVNVYDIKIDGEYEGNFIFIL